MSTHPSAGHNHTNNPRGGGKVTKPTHPTKNRAKLRRERAYARGADRPKEQD